MSENERERAKPYFSSFLFIFLAVHFLIFEQFICSSNLFFPSILYHVFFFSLETLKPDGCSFEEKQENRKETKGFKKTKEKKERTETTNE